MSSHCPSGKASHSSLANARIAARTFARQLNRERKLAEAMYGYRCAECGRWHITRRDEWMGHENTLLAEAAPEELQRWAMYG